MVQYGLYALAAAMVAGSVARIAFLLTCRRPVAARVCGTDETALERAHDAATYRWSRYRDPLADDHDRWKSVRVRVAYVVDAVEHRADVCHAVDRARDMGAALPDTHIMLWYDPAAPDRVTTSGPGAAMLTIACAALLAVAARGVPF